MATLNLDQIREALAGKAAAFRSVTEYQPAGGPGDKVFPPTYLGGSGEGGIYATEQRYIDGADVSCVLLDSVQSQANRMEMALLDEWESGRAPLPVISVNFTKDDIPNPRRVTSLEAPHRIVDAILRDSELDGVMFRQSATGKRLDTLDIRNATALFELCPTALVFGMWDSTGPRGGSGIKFQRTLVSEIIGMHAQQGKRTSSRLDPLQILRSAGPVYRTGDGGWTLEQAEAGEGNSRGIRPSEVGHGNYSPVNCRRRRFHHQPCLADHRALPAGSAPAALPDQRGQPGLPGGPGGAHRPGGPGHLRRHPGAGAGGRPPVPLPAVPTAPAVWELLDRPGDQPQKFELPSEQGREVYRQAVQEAQQAGLPWLEREMALKPSRQLIALVRESQLRPAETDADGGEG